MDEKLRKLQRNYLCQTTDAEVAAAYIRILEQRLSQPIAESIAESISLQQVQEETLVPVLFQQIELAEKIAKAGWARIQEVRANCQHELGEPMYGEYICVTCKKCGYDEWY